MKNNKKALFQHLRQFACPLCGITPTDVCHIQSRGAGGLDETWNLVSLCRRHHSEQHQTGWWKFCQKYPIMLKQLSYKGWQFIDEFGVKKLKRLTKE